MRRMLGFAAAVLAGALGSHGLHAQTAPTPIKITIGSGTLGLYHFFPLYVAQAEHFFEKEGLDVTFLTLNGGSPLVAALVGGSAGAAPAALEHVVIPGERAAGLTEFAMLFSTDPYSIVLSDKAIAKSGIKPDMPLEEKLKRMKGLTIGITQPGGASDTFIRFMMKAHGMNADQMVQMQPTSSSTEMIGELQRNMVDGISMSTPVDTMAISKGYGKSVISAFDGDVPELSGMPFSGMLATRAYIDKNPEVIRRVTRAITDAIKFSTDHPQQTRDDLFQYSVIKDRAAYDPMIARYQEGSAHTPVMTQPQFDKLVKWVQLGETQPLNAKFSASVDNSFAEQAAADIMGKK